MFADATGLVIGTANIAEERQPEIDRARERVRSAQPNSRVVIRLDASVVAANTFDGGSVRVACTRDTGPQRLPCFEGDSPSRRNCYGRTGLWITGRALRNRVGREAPESADFDAPSAHKRFRDRAKQGRNRKLDVFGRHVTQSRLERCGQFGAKHGFGVSMNLPESVCWQQSVRLPAGGRRKCKSTGSPCDAQGLRAGLQQCLAARSGCA